MIPRKGGDSLTRGVLLFSTAAAGFALCALGALAGSEPQSQSLVPTTLLDFFQPGSQPNGDVAYDEFVSSRNCRLCHEFEPDQTTLTEVFAPWQGSMMAQAARDPLFKAALVIANQDAAFAGDVCLRCHTPGGWLAGRSEPTSGSALIGIDRDGVSCSVCHRMVDPVLKPASPLPDGEILDAIDPLPTEPGGGNFVMDPLDRKRGPFETEAAGHMWIESPFHAESDLCATCHDVSNPVFLRNADGTYSPTAVNEPHPTGKKHDMFPLERTYSEWLNSDFARSGVDMGGRFGGNKTVVGSCQDCHMPDVTGRGADNAAAPLRADMPAHILAGGSTWIQDTIINLYPDDRITADYLEMGKAAGRTMLENACTLDATQQGARIRIRVTNETGHKLPTGYPEGRRMWINVRFYGGGGELILEHGTYENATAELVTNDTKVYEVKLGLDQAMATLTGVPLGESFHFALNNVVVKDNRVPPRGYTVSAFHAVRANPVGIAYADGQYWDDTVLHIPAAATAATVNVFYQSASREFITFLRDENHTNEDGSVLYEQWELTGKSPPVLMATAEVAIQAFPNGDTNGDNVIDLSDFQLWVSCAGGPDDPFEPVECEQLDFDQDGDVDVSDLEAFLVAFGKGD